MDMLYEGIKIYPRVKEAYEQKSRDIIDLFRYAGVKFPPDEIYITVFKFERQLELWARDKYSPVFSHIKTYGMTGFSGNLGPKTKEGDLQIPEGFYHINRFNPCSKYYLSIGIDYPNLYDRVAHTYENPGGDIFIHGGEKTVGCIPIGDENIKELYVIALSVSEPFTTNVHIFPMRLDDSNFCSLKTKYKNNLELLSFWEKLKQGYDYFLKYGTFAYAKISDGGIYMEINTGTTLVFKINGTVKKYVVSAVNGMLVKMFDESRVYRQMPMKNLQELVENGYVEVYNKK